MSLSFVVVAALAFVHLASSAMIDPSYVRYRDEAPFRLLNDVRLEMAKRSMAAHLSHFSSSGFDTLGGMGLGKRSKMEPEAAGEKRASLSTFDSLAGMGLGKRSDHHQLSSFDTLAGMGFGRR